MKLSATPPETLGKRIRALREERGLTQVQVAQAIGVSSALVSMWERGERLPGLVYLEALSKLFWVEVESFFGEKKPRESSPFAEDEERFLTPRDRVEVARWMDFVERFAEAGLEREVALEELRTGIPIRDGRLAPSLALKARESLGLGTQMPLGLSALMGLLEDLGVSVYRTPLEGILGGFRRSSKGGLALLVNGSLDPGVQALVLAQGLAHFLYHSPISRALYPQVGEEGSRLSWFRFARVWGAYFILPREVLLSAFGRGKVKGERVFLLAHRSGLDQAFVLHRLWMDGFLSEDEIPALPKDEKRVWQLFSPPSKLELPHSLGLERYSPGTLLVLREKILSEELSPKEGASILDVDTTTLSELLFPLEQPEPQKLDFLKRILNFRLPGRKASRYC